MNEIKLRIVKKALRNGKIFSVFRELKNFYHSDLWEGDTYKIISIDQYTGFNDKNKRKIFEGDILRFIDDHKDAHPMLVSWHKEYASFCLNKKGWLYSHFFKEAGNPEDCEIIGSIHQQKHLLK